MPVFYQYTGFDRQPLQGAQVRFGNTFDSFQKLLEAVSAFSNGLPSVSVGLAAHSLRAVDKQGLDFCQQLSIEQNNCPIHIHIAEQIAEVQACQAYLGATPIQYLSEQVNLDQNWCLVHATHTTEDELAVIAESGATVGLCVTTEANLGDGIFPGKAFHAMKGQWGIGSDSHISVNPWDELRWLEYTQRLVSKQRTVFARDEMPHTGQFLFEQAVSGGASALRSKAGRIAAGYRADLLCLDEVLSTAQNHFDYWIFAANRNPVKHVLVGGEWVIKNGQHHEQAVIREAFINVLAG